MIWDLRFFMMWLMILVSHLASAEVTPENYTTMDGTTLKFGVVSDFTADVFDVYHLQPDQFIPGNILAVDHKTLRTTNGTFTEIVVGSTAGNGYRNGAGTNALVSYPTVCQLSHEIVLLGEYYNHCIRKLNRTNSNTVTDFVGNCGNRGYQDGIGTAVQFEFVSRLLQDTNDANIVYVSEGVGNIRKLYVDEKMVTTLVYNGFDEIFSILWDPYYCDVMWVADKFTLKKFELSDLRLTLYGATQGHMDGSLDNVQFKLVADVAVLHKNVYAVADSNNNQLRIIDTEACVATSICTGSSLVSGGHLDNCSLKKVSSLLYAGGVLYIGGEGYIKSLSVEIETAEGNSVTTTDSPGCSTSVTEQPTVSSSSSTQITPTVFTYEATCSASTTSSYEQTKDSFDSSTADIWSSAGGASTSIASTGHIATATATQSSTTVPTTPSSVKTSSTSQPEQSDTMTATMFMGGTSEVTPAPTSAKLSTATASETSTTPAVQTSMISSATHQSTTNRIETPVTTTAAITVATGSVQNSTTAAETASSASPATTQSGTAPVTQSSTFTQTPAVQSNTAATVPHSNPTPVTQGNTSVPGTRSSTSTVAAQSSAITKNDKTPTGQTSTTASSLATVSSGTRLTHSRETSISSVQASSTVTASGPPGDSRTSKTNHTSTTSTGFSSTMLTTFSEHSVFQCASGTPDEYETRSCTKGCFGLLVNGKSNIGCLEDLEFDRNGFSSVTTCGTDERLGRCYEYDDGNVLVENCMRCCNHAPCCNLAYKTRCNYLNSEQHCYNSAATQICVSFTVHALCLLLQRAKIVF